MLTFVYHQDSGHGWVAVKRTLLAKYVPLSEITAYSYQKGATVYLEEDCDASKFLKALRATGEHYHLVSKQLYDRHPIRSYEGFRA